MQSTLKILKIKIYLTGNNESVKKNFNNNNKKQFSNLKLFAHDNFVVILAKK